MGLRDCVAAAIAGRKYGVDRPEAALAAVGEFIARDVNVAHEVATSVDLRQAANETPINYVKRIVGAYHLAATVRE